MKYIPGILNKQLILSGVVLSKLLFLKIMNQLTQYLHNNLYLWLYYFIYNFILDRPSPRKEVRSNSQQNSSSTSFQDFQESVNDAWEIGDDEFCNILGTFFCFTFKYLI